MKNKVLSFYGINRTQKGDFYKITLVENREDGEKVYYVAFVKANRVTDDPTKERAFVNLSIKKLEFKEKSIEDIPQSPMPF